MKFPNSLYLNKTKEILPKLAAISMAILIVFFAGRKLKTVRQVIPLMDESNPGFYSQWFNQRVGVDGIIPAWLPAKWAMWDKSQAFRRSSEKIIDTFYPLGPLDIGGRTRGIWIDPRNENIILAAAISGGVWRSENRGKSWSPLNEQEVSLIAATFTSNPFNPDIIYYGTGEGRPAGPANMGGNGLYKSLNGGKSFTPLASTINKTGFDIIWDIKHSLDDSNTLFVGTHTQGLWRSKDGGLSWSQVFNGGNQQVNNILVLPNGRILISLQSTGVYASDNNGDFGTWSAVSFPSFPSSGAYRRMQFANCKNSPNRCYMIVEAMNFSDTAVAFYASTDGGKIWTKKPRPAFVGASYQAYCLMLGVHPSKPDRIIAGGVSIAQSNDGGNTWIKKSTGHSDHHSYTSFPNTDARFLIGNDGGIYEYDWDIKTSISHLNTGYVVTQFYAGNYGPYGSISIAGAQDNGVHVANGILNTKKFFGADGAYCHIGLQDGKIAYFSTQNEGIRRVRNFDPNTIPAKTDKINDPLFAAEGVEFINSYSINPANQQQLYYRTDRYLYRTTNEGDNWSRVTSYHGGLKAIAVSNHSNPTVYTGGSLAQLYRINNAATAAAGTEDVFSNSVPLTVTNDFISSIVIHPNDVNSIYISFSTISNEPRIWKVSGLNGVPTFTAIAGNLPPSLPINYIAVDPENPNKNIFAATDFGLYYTTDSGITWQKDYRFPNVAIHELKMRKDRHLFIYSHGRGMWLATLLGSKNPFPTESIKISPNPAIDYLNIQVSKVPTNGKCEIYNTVGMKIRDLSFNQDNLHIPVGTLTPGYYFVRVKTEFASHTEKVLIVRQ